MEPSPVPTPDFSTNRHSASARVPTRHGDLYFSDGNIVILAESSYFLVHQGLLSRHSDVFDKLISDMDSSPGIEGRPVLPVSESPEDVAYLLQALYDGVSFLTYDGAGFWTVSRLLRILTKYRVDRIRNEVLRALSVLWPTTLAHWEARECAVTDSGSTYTPYPAYPHPIEIIALAREIDFPVFLPSAMYDLSRSTPSEAAIGIPSSNSSNVTRLDHADLLRVLRGREHASRYFSTFIVNELEGREPSPWCLRRKEVKPVDSRACQIAFEAITFELLRDVNGIVSNRTSDPIYAMADAELMQTKEGQPGEENTSPMRTCETCRTEFGAAVDAAKEEFWRKLPSWFGVEVPDWG